MPIPVVNLLCLAQHSSLVAGGSARTHCILNLTTGHSFLVGYISKVYTCGGVRDHVHKIFGTEDQTDMVYVRNVHKAIFITRGNNLPNVSISSATLIVSICHVCDRVSRQ